MPKSILFHNEASPKRRAALSAYLASLPNALPRPEYPRPQMVRPDWLCLNGEWEFTFDPYDAGLLERWQDQPHLPDVIVVPFAPQTALSQKDDKRLFTVAWYARRFEVPDDWHGQDILLHFGAVDYRCEVWVNGEAAGHNQGGHVPFSFNIAPYLKDGRNRLCLRVEDTQDPAQPRGKQSVRGVPESCDYYCTTGIWQTVWLEPVPAARIQEVRLTPQVGDDPAQDALEIRVLLHAPATGWQVQVDVYDDLLEGGTEGRPVIASAQEDAPGAIAHLTVPLPNSRRWSPATPALYGLRVRLLHAGKQVDEVASYAGLRSVTLHDGRLYLNGVPTYLKMVLDQGYWPDGGMTAPTDAALRADVEWCKAFGFNGARKHQKVEDPRWLYWCDRLGLLVWGEMANARAWSPRAEEMFLSEWERAVQRDYSHPSVIVWVPLNESWGVPGLRRDNHAQYAFVERIVSLTRRLDGTRPVISNDGWEQAAITDILSIHDYAPTGSELRRRYASALNGGSLPHQAGASGRAIFAGGGVHAGQPVMLTEVGGFLMRPDLPKEQWDPLYAVYASTTSSAGLLKKYRDLMRGLADLPFVSGFCYTQLTDIELEINGLLTYDRRPKIAPEELAAVHAELFGK